MRVRLNYPPMNLPMMTHAGARQTATVAVRGFSFTELLFAVMILGIGFILVAAIFPVGLAQSKSNFDETHAAALARSGAAEIGRVAQQSDFGAGLIQPMQIFGNDSATTTRIASFNMISPSDPRYAWVGLYRRLPSGSGRTAQLCMFVVNRSQPFQIGTDLVSLGTNDVRLLEPRLVFGNLTQTSATINSPGTGTGQQYNHNAAAPGGFIVIWYDNITPASGYTIAVEEYDGTSGTWTGIATPDAEDRAQVEGRNILGGRVYRLGSNTGGTTFGWFPGSDMNESLIYTNTSGMKRRITITGLDEARCYIVGRNRTGIGDEFEGGVMDVAYYTTFISLK